MGTDAWGIDDGYFDTVGNWYVTSPETWLAIRGAMGGEGDCPPAPDGGLRFITSGVFTPTQRRGRLVLEDGGALAVDGGFPADLPEGYHTLHLDDSDTPVRLVIAPGRCLEPEPCWGWAAQVYAARSAAGWGIGDLADVRRLGRWATSLGARVLLVNPLAAAAPLETQEASPYCPSSRRFLNPLYLRIEEVPGADVLGDALAPLAAVGRSLNQVRQIQRDAVFRLKDEALRMLWTRFTGDDRFDRYRREQGEELEPFAVWCALAERFGGDWRAWPAEYRKPTAAAVARFAAENRRQVDYHGWLQWLLQVQLESASREIGLVQDLPVGVDPGGADAWIWQDYFADGCTIGAPPDLFNNQGQDWAMPPLVPHKLRAAGYGPFVATLRAVLRHARGLRIDHVMGLFRLFWIPRGMGAAAGAYVRYPADELLALVALESRRAGAFVVGEDLGTVENATRWKLAECRAMSFQVLWFEERPPAEYPRSGMAAVSTHDLPTVAGVWSGRDGEAQRAIGAASEEAVRHMRRRFEQRVGLPPDTPVDAVIQRTYELLAEAPSAVLLATLDDALAIEERPNMPGTTTQWPNWRLAIPGGLEALEASPLPRRIAAALQRKPGPTAHRPRAP
jgi:4-alpha-glucanotransferase